MAQTTNKPATILDLAVVAASLGSNVAEAEAALGDPLVVRALEMTTNRPLEELAANPHALAGALNTAKGKYFELLVEKKLNASEVVGDLVIKADQHVQLADSMNQPGWDIAVLDSHDEVADVIQLKATDSQTYIAETLDRYPDIKILATTEVAGIDPTHNMVIDSGISNRTIEHFLGDAIDYGANGSISFVDAFNPLFPLIFIAATEGYKVVLGKKSVELAVLTSTHRAGNSMTGLAVGSLCQAIGFGWISIVPAVIAASAGPGGIKKAIEQVGIKLRASYEQSKREELATRDDRNQYNAVEHSAMLARNGSSRVTSADDMQKLRPYSLGIAAIDDFGLAVVRAVDVFPEQLAKENKRQALRTEAQRKRYEDEEKARQREETARIDAMTPAERERQEFNAEVRRQYMLARNRSDGGSEPTITEIIDAMVRDRGT